MEVTASDDMVYRVGIVGTGENARDHGRACGRIRRAELAAICDIAEDALHRFGEQFGVSRRYTHLAEMLDREQLDIVIISTWGVHHASICNAVARSGKARLILVEKPLAQTVAECQEMIRLAREHNVVLTEGFKFRYHPQHLRLKEIIDSGQIGEVKSLHSTLSSPMMRITPQTNWRFQRARGGGSVYDTASYLIHFARYVFDAEPRSVYAIGKHHESADVETSTAILLQFPGAATAQLTTSYELGYCQSTTVLGTRGWIRMDLPYDQRSARDVEFVTTPDLPSTIQVFMDSCDTEIYQFAPANQFDLQLAHLCSCLDNGGAPRIAPEFSLGNMRVIDAVFESLRTHQPVELAG